MRPAVSPSTRLDDQRPEAAARRLGLTFSSSLAGYSFSAGFLSRIPIHYAREQNVLGLVSDGSASDTLYLAMSELRDWHTVDLLGRLFPNNVVPLLCPNDTLQRAINDAYQTKSGQAEQLISRLDPTEVLETLGALNGREDLLDGNARAPVVRLVNMILFEAVQSLASDVHIQPGETEVAVRIRIDGVLYDSFKLPRSIQDEVISRVKVMGRMNIAEKRLPQDGRATVEVGDRLIDLRIASLPTHLGERVVIRLLDKSARLSKLEDLGMPADSLRDFRKLIAAEHGLILVTGPTGSGKSTTLYAAIQELDGIQQNILTLEDPIEYQLPGISQTQVNEKKGMTFAAGLRNILRQDPDVIMVGEIRDRETAVMAIQSAQTGHLVFSTLHTNDATSAVTRLLDLGIEPYLLASSLNGVVAQRLVRRICSHCACGHPIGDDEVDWMKREGGLPDIELPSTMTTGVGCERCRLTGFRGRIGIFEILTMSELTRQHISLRSPSAKIRQAAVKRGMRTLRQDGVRKVRDGVTVIGEVEQATMQDADMAELNESPR